jgi:CheY-like chemotaxis protein/AraC-like DNA-binding protein
MENSPDNRPYPDTFYLNVKQILENLYDFPYLNRHPLARSILAARTRPSETDGQRLRRVVMAAIEELRPADESSARTNRGRFHRLLSLRYAESSTMQEVARELGISERQAYRDLKRAEEVLAALLWEQVSGEVSQLLSSDESSETDKGDELEAFSLQLSGVLGQDLLQHAVRAVDRLADQQGIAISMDLPAEPVHVYTDQRLAQQVLISLLSGILQNSAAQSVTLELEEDLQAVFFRITYDLAPNQSLISPGSKIINQMIERLGWKMTSQLEIELGQQKISLEARTNEAVLLVIDDNTALIDLLRRYLTNARCEVVGVTDGAEGLRTAQALRPDAILLDIMMPGIDGWEILQRLKANPETSSIPVVICSIFNDPGLAASLGASHILPKPVKREDLIHLLTRLQLV